MSLSKFSDIFNLADVVKGTFPHCFNIPNNYGYDGLLPVLHYYEPDGLKRPARSGCMKFNASYLADTGIDLFRSCTIACACMHVFGTSYLKENTIARVPPNGYRSMRNYSNKSMGWITY